MGRILDEVERKARDQSSSTYITEVKGLLKNSDDLHLVAGLAAETGEVCSVFQKSSYKNLPIDVVNLKEELGDILFYVAAIADKYGTSIEELQKENIFKLRARHASI